MPLFGGTAEDWCGRGSGVDDKGVQLKIDLVNKALDTHKDYLDKPLEVLARLGGREFAAMCGAVLAARINNVPVIVDGFNTTAAVAVLHKLDPRTLDHCIFSHCSAEGAHRRALDAMGKTAIVDLGFRLGEGTGAAVVAGLAKAACQMHNGMATFADCRALSRSVRYRHQMNKSRQSRLHAGFAFFARECPFWAILCISSQPDIYRIEAG